MRKSRYLTVGFSLVLGLMLMGTATRDGVALSDAQAVEPPQAGECLALGRGKSVVLRDLDLDHQMQFGFLASADVEWTGLPDSGAFEGPATGVLGWRDTITDDTIDGQFTHLRVHLRYARGGYFFSGEATLNDGPVVPFELSLIRDNTVYWDWVLMLELMDGSYASDLTVALPDESSIAAGCHG